MGTSKRAKASGAFCACASGETVGEGEGTDAALRNGLRMRVMSKARVTTLQRSAASVELLAEGAGVTPGCIVMGIDTMWRKRWEPSARVMLRW